MFSAPVAPYSKPFLELADQVVLLQARGLEISDTAAAQECLRRIGYYRLSAYWYPFRVLTSAQPPIRSDRYLPDSRFDDAVELYNWDKKLKILVMDALEQVEIAVRVELCLQLGRKGAFAYLDAAQLHPNFSTRSTSFGPPPFATWISKMNELYARSDEEFVRHFKSKHQWPMPIWMACELWDFGMMSRLSSGLKAPDKQAVAVSLGVANGALLESWLRALNYVRNIAAHHGRLWNRALVISPTLPQRGAMPAFDALHSHPNLNKRIYGVLCLLSYLLDAINPASEWKSRVVALTDTFPVMPHAKLSDAGFPANWKTHAFWN